MSPTSLPEKYLFRSLHLVLLLTLFPHALYSCDVLSALQELQFGPREWYAPRTARPSYLGQSAAHVGHPQTHHRLAAGSGRTGGEGNRVEGGRTCELPWQQQQQ